VAVRPGPPVEVFVAAGADAWHDAQALRACDTIRLAATPRHATVLLVAGTIPDLHREPLDRVHDQLPHPRAVVSWDELELDAGRDRDVVDSVATVILERSDAVTADPSSSSPDRLPDEEPNEWRGVGPFGQGGQGMMGGTPYGRPMAMTADDRDGLALDELHLRLGPFLGQLPGGLVADVALQGDVIASIEFMCSPAAPLVNGDRDLTASRRLLWLSHALDVQGLDAFSVRAARLARRSNAASDSTVLRDFSSLCRRLRWTGIRSALSGVGTREGVDTWARWTSHLDAIASALGDEPHAVGSPGEKPITASELAAMLTGMTVTDAVSTIVGLDVEVPAASEARADS
jgi:hypothetical protein